MSQRVKRRYRSPRRTEQASATQREIMEAARRLFSAQGYGSTTMEAVAGAADISVATVYLSFGSKFGLLSALVNDAAEDPSLDVQQVLNAVGLERQLAIGVHLIRQLHERTVPISGILRSGRGTDPRLAELWDDWRARHLAAVSQVARHLVAAGLLRGGVDHGKATDVLYTLAGSETYRQLVIERGWRPDQFEEWLTDAVRQLLLAKP